MELTRKYMSHEECEMLTRAFKFADAAHEGQRRKSGEPFIVHPIEVAKILADLRMDAQTVCAALLHDTVEDTKTTPEEVEELFGRDVRDLVEGVTKITRIEVENLTDEQAATIRKMLVAMSKDIRVIVIKLADRLHNMRTLSSLAEDRRIFKARETLEIYAPIAHRLGINSIKWVLEDLSFFYLEPNKYKQVSRMVTETRQEREAYLSDVIDVLSHEMKSVGVEARIMGRPKHLYSIYQKMVKKGKGFSQIYDLIAVRIIVDSVKDCYTALGAVHSLWHPMPGRFKDYIAMPKYNMYQSLHTTVIGPAARPLEVQIRTEEMHKASEYGVAAHWRYKEGGGKVDAGELDKQLAWLREMVDWQDETQDSREFLKSLKMDLDNAEVYVFTPNGEVKTLRAGSTPVDFAYAIHTEVGNHCVGAKVNGAIVPLTYELHTGDRVEILTSKNSGPSRDWIKMVKTPSARNKIRSYFSKATRSTDLQDGHATLMRELRKHGVGLSNTKTTKAVKQVADAMGFNDVDDMLVQVARGNESVSHVAGRVLRELKGEEELTPATPKKVVSVGVTPPMLTRVTSSKEKVTHSQNGIVVRGLDDVLVRLSRCCNPVPGDDIIGFVTRGRGVSVHRSDCPNATDLKRDPARIIDVAWEGSKGTSTVYKIEIYLEALDRLNLLLDVTSVLSEVGANVLSCTTNTHKDGVVEMRFLFQIGALDKIEDILGRLRGVEGVFDAHRI
jgi:GTP pyrophosphokinase